MHTHTHIYIVLYEETIKLDKKGSKLADTGFMHWFLRGEESKRQKDGLVSAE